MKLNKKYSIIVGICGIIIGLTKIPYTKELVQTIKTIDKDKFTPQIKKELEASSVADMEDFLQLLAKHQHKKCPIKISNNDTILDFVYKDNKLIWIKKIKYDVLLNLQNIKQDKEKLTRVLTEGMIKDTCSQKLMNFLVINKNISVEYRFNNLNMKLIDDIVVDKKSCINWHKNNKTYTFVDSVFKFFRY